MKLQDLHKRLYSRQSDIESRKPQTDVYDPRTKNQPEEKDKVKEGKNKDWVIETGTTQRQKTLMLLIGSVLAGILVIGGGGYLVYKILKKDFRQQQVQIKIEVPPAVNLNEDVAISIPYANNNPVSLKDTHLTLEVPSTFMISGTKPQADSTSKLTASWVLGDLAPQKSGILEVKGRFTGREEESVLFKGNLTYTPSNFNSQFRNETSVATKVIGVPLTLFIEATREAANGYAVNYTVKVRNNGNEPFQELVVNLDYPLGFTQVSSSEALSGDKKNVWKIPTVLSNEEKVLTVEGRMEGSVGDQKYLTARIGKEEMDGFKEYIRKEAVTTITEPPVLIKQEVGNGQRVVHKGDELEFKVNFENKSDRAIGQAIAKVKLSGAIFDTKRIIVDDGGWYDSNNGEVVWQGGKAPALALINPGDKGTLGFRIRIADYIPFTLDKKSNFFGQTTVTIESPEMPTPIGNNKIVTGNTIEFKLSSQVGLQCTAFYNDGTIPNSGPIPPTVGKKTTYTVHWNITNAFNDLRNVEIKTVLPYGVEWINKVFPGKTGVEYRENTREVIWNLERVPAGAGIDKPSSNLVFQLGLTPTEDNAGKAMELISETTIKGTDTYTQEVISKQTGPINSTVPDDKSMNEEMGIVIRPGEEDFSEYSQNYKGDSLDTNTNASTNSNKNGNYN